MTFFDPDGRPVTLDQWRTIYRPYYFLGGPTLGRRLNSRNQSSRYVEAEVEKLLMRPQGQILSPDDLKLIMAWKVGEVNHGLSGNRIVFRDRWRDHLIAQGQYREADFSKGIHYLGQVTSKLEPMTAKDIFYLLPGRKSELPHFGPVYWLTIIYFIKRGEWPIFDKFAWLAAHAISTGLPPGSTISYPFDLRSPEWSDYSDYVDTIKGIFGFQNIPRQDDQALWVYGHFFSTAAAEKDSPRKEEAQRVRRRIAVRSFGSVKGRITEPNKGSYEINISPVYLPSLPVVQPGPGSSMRLIHGSRACECVLHVTQSGTTVWISTNSQSPFNNPVRLYDFLRSLGKKQGDVLELKVNGSDLVIQ
jgi:hypothetical protein